MGTLSSAQSGLEGYISSVDDIVNDDTGASEGHSPGGYQRQESADESSDDDEDGFPKQRLGSGVWDTGPPMVSELMGKRRAFVDGAGLCSPGRWPPEQRKDESLDGRLGMAKQCFEQLQQLLRDKMDPCRLVLGLACGRHHDSPFDDNLLDDARLIIKRQVHRYGTQLDLDHVPDRQPFRLAMLEEFLRLSGDPDFRVFYTSSNSFANGVSLGVNEKLPRTPAVFARKCKWRDYSDEQEPSEDVRCNYPAAEINSAALEQQFRQEEKLGAMVNMSMAEAKAKYGSNLRIASLGAIKKADDSFRVTHDGTHGAGVNGRIKVRDQLVCPTAGDMRQACRELEPTFALTTDIRRAHRLLKVKEEQWGLQACRVSSSSDDVWVNTVGTFGISSVAVHWSRLMGGLQRAVFYLLRQIAVFILTYVDDNLWLARGSVAVALLFLCALGLPIAWRKFHGGLSVGWVGYHLDMPKKLLGIGANKARWLMNWIGKALQDDYVVLAEVSSVLGRFSFAFAALEPYDRSWGLCTHGPPRSRSVLQD